MVKKGKEAKETKVATLRKDNTYKELEKLAKERGKTIRDIVMDENDSSFDVVAEIFYKSLPVHYRWLMGREKFKDFFLKNRELMLNQAGL